MEPRQSCQQTEKVFVLVGKHSPERCHCQQIVEGHCPCQWKLDTHRCWEKQFECRVERCQIVAAVVQETIIKIKIPSLLTWNKGRPLLDLLMAVGLQRIHGGDKPCHVAQNDADHLGQCVPVILIQLHRIRGESRWEDFIVEINHCHFDLKTIICL